MSRPHPSESDLTLLAGGECGLLARLRLMRHVRRCAACEETVAEYRELRSAMTSTADDAGPSMAAGEWNRIAAEMRANIRLGLAAGECVREKSPLRAKAFGAWKLPSVPAGNPRLVLAGGLTVLALASVYLAGSGPRVTRPRPPAIPTIETSEAGIALRTGSGSMQRSFMLLKHAGSTVDQSANAQGTIRAYNFDEETGTVTVSKVYLD